MFLVTRPGASWSSGHKRRALSWLCDNAARTGSDIVSASTVAGLLVLIDIVVITVGACWICSRICTTIDVMSEAWFKTKNPP